MKKNIAILGSTGTIGLCLLDIIKTDIKNFQINLLTANKNYKLLLKQARKFKVKNVIICNKDSLAKFKKENKDDNIKVYNNFDQLNKILKKKNDFIMSAISGLDGLEPTLKSIPHTSKILIANKESLICGWNLINKSLIKNKTKLIPIDSEHFSIWSLMNHEFSSNIDTIYITASGGPFYNLPLKKFNFIKPIDALKHPKWNMGKKISIDSATLMNKVFEVIEAKNIFSTPYKRIKILMHPESYLHAIVMFKNGLTKLLIHDTSMKFPIFNSIYSEKSNRINYNKLNLKKINNLDLNYPDKNRYPSIKILNHMPQNFSLFETIIVSANDELVDLFLNNKIKFNEIVKILLQIAKSKKFIKYKNIMPKKIEDITKLSEFVRLKIRSLSV